MAFLRERKVLVSFCRELTASFLVCFLFFNEHKIMRNKVILPSEIEAGNMSGLFPLNIGRKNSCWQSKTLLRVQLVFSRRPLHYCLDCICPDTATQSLCCCDAAENEQHGYYTRYCAAGAGLAVLLREQANSPCYLNDIFELLERTEPVRWGLSCSTIWLCKAKVFLILCKEGRVPWFHACSWCWRKASILEALWWLSCQYDRV